MVHAGDADDLPPHFVVDGFAVAEYRDADAGPGTTAHAADRVLQMIRLHRYAVDGDDLVAAAYARARRRRADNRRNDLDGTFYFRNLHADAGVAAGRADAYVAILVGIEILGVGIQVVDHAANSALEQLAVVKRLDIIPLDALHHFGEQPRVLPVQLFLGRRPAFRKQATTDREA